MTERRLDDRQAAMLSQLEAKWRASRGYEIRGDLHLLERSATTFLSNVGELLHYVNAFENAFPNPLLRPANRRQLLEFGSEVVRLFQNTIAAGESFLEHCQRVVGRRYRGTPCHEEFAQAYADLIGQSPVCIFIDSLRGLMLHNEPLSPVFSTALVDFSDPYQSMQSIEISADGLRREWAKARNKKEKDKAQRAAQYLKSLRSESINIRRVIDAYVNALKSVGDWLLQRLRVIEASALQEARVLRGELMDHATDNMKSWLEASAERDDVSTWFEIVERKR